MMYPWQAFAIQPKFSHKIALRTAQGDIFNWAQVAEKVNQTVSFLQNKGVNPESAVAFIGKNTENILFLKNLLRRTLMRQLFCNMTVGRNKSRDFLFG